MLQGWTVQNRAARWMRGAAPHSLDEGKPFLGDGAFRSLPMKVCCCCRVELVLLRCTLKPLARIMVGPHDLSDGIADGPTSTDVDDV